MLLVPFWIQRSSSFRYSHSLRVVRSPAGSNMGRDTGKPDIRLCPLAAGMKVGHRLLRPPEDNNRDIEEHRGKAALHQQALSLRQMEVAEEESVLQLAFSSFPATAV